MKNYSYLLVLFSLLLPSLSHARDITPKWRDVMEVKDLTKAREKAEEEKKFVTILVCNKTYDSENQGAQQSVDIIEDTIKALKSSSIIVRSSYEGVRSLKQGDVFNLAVIEGVKKSGNTTPMIIILNPATKKLVEVIMPNDVLKEGSKAFRDIKKAARDLKKK